MVGCRAHKVGKEGAPGEEKGEPCGTPKCVILRYLSEEADGAREEG